VHTFSLCVSASIRSAVRSGFGLGIGLGLGLVLVLDLRLRYGSAGIIVWRHSAMGFQLIPAESAGYTRN